MWLLDDGDDVLAAVSAPKPAAASSGEDCARRTGGAVGRGAGRRYILDNPELVRGRSVLDVGSGCGAGARRGQSRRGQGLRQRHRPAAAVAFLANADACGVRTAVR